jgi:creatinine amidohydrolase
MGSPPKLGRLTSASLVGNDTTLVVPVGSTEQHGPHLPLDTDTRIATAVADAVARRLGTAVVAPPICYGASGEHQEFPGTVSIGTEALRIFLVEYGRSACGWANRLVFVNGHGGNVDALRAAVVLLRAESRDAVWFSCTAPGADPHAGHTETSVLLALSPAEVRTGECRRGNTEPLARLMPDLRSGGVGAVSPSGVLGDPTTATAAAGAVILAAMVADGEERLRRWQPDATGMLA